MKRVMILSGGTSTAWHIADVLRRYFHEHIYLIICDINPRHLVHTSLFADFYIQVPPICSPEYYRFMLQTIEERRVDILIPLIDDDIFIFHRNNNDLIARGVYSTAPCKTVIEGLSNKENLENTLLTLGIPTPHIFKSADSIDPNGTYFVKAPVGCGSRGSYLADGKTAAEVISKRKGQIVQEICHAPEITVDVAHDGRRVYTICRERVEIKLGVSTKCRVYHDPDIQHILERIVAKIDLPPVFCVQFMRDVHDRWFLTDFNLRSGGGTAISAAIGFEAVRFAAAQWLDQPVDSAWVSIPAQEHYVVRAYQEIVTQ